MYRRLALVTLLAAAVGVAAACSSTKGASVPPTSPLAPIGSLPDSLDDLEETLSTGFVAGVSRTTVPLAPEDRLGRIVDGNRVIMLGDSVLASTAERYSNDMCEALVPLGWQVELNAESGRAIQWGNYVLDFRLEERWDLAVVFLGNNYGDNQRYYFDQLSRIVDRLSPIPVLVLTVSEFKESRLEVNEAIFEVAVRFPNVYVLDWAVVTGLDSGLTGSDRLHLSVEGRERLAREVALALGEAPSGRGDCLPSDFEDDSMGPVTGPNDTIDTSVDTTVGATVDTSPDTTASTVAPETTVAANSTPPTSHPKP